DLTEKDLGYAKLVEERKVADDKMVFVEGCKNPKAVSILVRGGAEHVVDEAERAIHDALCVIRNVVQEGKIVGGGGAPEVELARYIRDYAMKFKGKVQLAMQKFADALEIIPTILAQSGGLEPVDAIVELRSLHEQGKTWAGVDVVGGRIVEDITKLNVLEPVNVKKQSIKSATEAAIMILRIDDIIAAAPPKEKKGKEKGFEEGTGAGEFE
ncbi:MAG: thermosome subunit, partial [Thermoprotei archaeon]|nr:thermosome subunit [Thermoprotei archaeon]